MFLKPFQYLLEHTYESPFLGSLIKVQGPDALPFLHRMSTQNLLNKSQDEIIFATFLNPQGRIVDAAYVLFHAEDDILLLSSHPKPDHLIDWLSRYHFAESLSIEHATIPMAPFYVLGKDADIFSEQMASVKMIKVFESHLQKAQSLPAYLVVSNEPRPPLKPLLQEAFDDLRIASIAPAYPFEISDSWGPLEVGLEKAISWQKGCYVGQEVISKIETYQKRAKKLFGIQTQPSTFLHMQTNIPIYDNGSRIGLLTSIAHQFHPEVPIALAVALKGSPTEASLLIDDQNLPIKLVPAQE